MGLRSRGGGSSCDALFPPWARARAGARARGWPTPELAPAPIAQLLQAERSTTWGRRPSRVREAEETVHPPTAISLLEQDGDVPPELRVAHTAGVAKGLLERAKLRRVIRCDASRRDDQLEVHVAQRRPVAPRHRRQLGGTSNRVELRPFEYRRVGVQRGICHWVVCAVRADETRIQGVDAGIRLTRGRPRRLRTGEAEDAQR